MRRSCHRKSDDVDCVVAAGGDGTVARAGRVLAGGAMPLAILPLGTANNIADSLDIRGEVRTLAERWHQAKVAKIDVGFVECGGRRSAFFESVGCGLVTHLHPSRRCDPVEGSILRRTSRTRGISIATRCAIFAPRPYDIVLDGERISGEFLLIEALNTPSIGPKLEFTPDANAADGFLSLVVAAESDRDLLVEYLSARQDRSDVTGPPEVVAGESDRGHRSG